MKNFRYPLRIAIIYFVAVICFYFAYLPGGVTATKLICSDNETFNIETPGLNFGSSDFDKEGLLFRIEWNECDAQSYRFLNSSYIVLLQRMANECSLGQIAKYAEEKNVLGLIIMSERGEEV